VDRAAQLWTDPDDAAYLSDRVLHPSRYLL